MIPFGKYFLLERINVGGMAEVFKAKTLGVEGFEKLVAIKRILPSVAEDEEFIKMFVDEAKITSQLSHANLAHTFDLGKIDDTYYIAMEYVPGKDLRAVFERMKRRAHHMPLPLAAWVMSRVLEGLDYAHKKRDQSGRELHIVHRDVSPQNIILSYEGEVKLIDFGIAKAATKISKTQAGILKGKFGYMSPEQVRGLPLDGRSDVFAAGVVLYEICTGERLFTGASDFSVLEKVQQAKVQPPSQLDPDIPFKLERIILKALARDPDDRYQSASEAAHELLRYLHESQPRQITRDDAAAFMKSTFPEDERRDQDLPQRRPPPRVAERPPAPVPMVAKSIPPPLPGSLFAEVADREDMAGNAEDATITVKGFGPEDPPAQIIVRSRSAPPPPDTDGPTRPMSMAELAAKEREMALAAEPSATDPAVTGQSSLLDVPRGDQTLRTAPPVHEEQPKRPPPPDLSRGLERRIVPPLPPPDDEEDTPVGNSLALTGEKRSTPPLPTSLLDGVSTPRRPSKAPDPVRIEDQKTQVKSVRPAPTRPPPAPVPTAPLPASAFLEEESTGAGKRNKRTKLLAGAVLALAVVVAVALLWPASSGETRTQPASRPGGAGSLSVSVEPADSVLLLDGAQVKAPSDTSYSEPRLSAGVEHVLTARHDGFAEQTQTLTLAKGERRELALTLKPVLAAIGILSSPPGAQVYVDGLRHGTTPVFLGNLDSQSPHAVTVEKKCYRAWQVALPARSGRRELAATLQPLPGACPGTHLEQTGMPQPSDMPAEEESGAQLGFLNLGSRPSAQVMIDGVDIGMSTPLVSWPLKSGNHDVRLVSASGASKNLSVGIDAGQTQSEIADLAPPPAAAPRKHRRR